MANEDIKSTRFFSLYTTVQGRVYVFLLMMLHNRTAAEEVLQDTAATMWEKFEQFREGDNFGAWAVTIARYKAMEYLRANQKTRMLFLEERYLDLADAAAPSADDFQQRLRALDICLEKLESDQRTLLALRYRSNVPVKEISQRLGSSPRLIYKKLVGIFGLLRVCIQRTLAGEDATTL